MDFALGNNAQMLPLLTRKRAQDAHTSERLVRLAKSAGIGPERSQLEHRLQPRANKQLV